MHQILGRLRKVPLQVAAQPRVVIEDAQHDRTLPLAGRREYLERTVVEIKMPQRSDILRFVAADLSGLAPPRRADFTGALRPRAWLADQTVSLHIPPYGRIRT